MDVNCENIVSPLPVYPPDINMIMLLVKELQEARESNFILVRDLEIERHKAQQLECHLSTLTPKRRKNSVSKLSKSPSKAIRKNSSSDTFASFSELKEALNQIGSYTAEIRKQKIQRYKEKVKSYRAKVHVSRKFSGRSFVAKEKPRINGKFIKSCPLFTLE